MMNEYIVERPGLVARFYRWLCRKWGLDSWLTHRLFWRGWTWLPPKHYNCRCVVVPERFTQDVE